MFRVKHLGRNRCIPSGIGDRDTTAAKKPHDLLNFSVLDHSEIPPSRRDLGLSCCVREADSPALTGIRWTIIRNDGTSYLHFEYNVVRVWEIPVETLLEGGIGTLPLAPLAKVTPNQIPAVVRRMQERLETEPGPNIDELWMATRILLGLRYKRNVVNDLLKGVGQMRNSDTYREILEEGEARGRIKGEQDQLIKFATKRLGMPSTQAEKTIAAITSSDQLSDLLERVLAVETWDELFVGAK